MKNKAINTKHRNGLASLTSSNPISSSDSNAPRRRGNSKEQPVLNKKDNNNKNAKVIKRQTLIVSMGKEDNGWYDIARQTPGRNDTIATVSKTGGAPVVTGANNIVSNWRQRADELWVNEMSLFMEIYKSNQTSDDRWIEATMTKGTMKDKIAAMSILIANHPFHQLKILDNLLNLCSSTGNGNSRISQMAGEALTDLFINTLLPPNRNLIPLNQRPFHLYEQQNSVKTNNYKTLSPRVLLLWRYEELLKQKYMTFLNNCIASWLNDALDQHKNFALKIAITLLSDRSEGEAILLGLIVNKIGDPSRKVAAAAGHQLRRLLETHPVMTPIVAREVQQLAFRPHVSPRTLYNCIVFLNQLRLTDIDKELPVSLVRTYFKLFEVAVASSRDGEHQSTTKRTSKEKNQKKTSSSSTGGTNSNMTTEIKSRLLGALLTGVNRARPFLPKSDQKMEEYVDALYRISHKAPSASASTQALMLLFHLAIGTAEATSVTPADTNHTNNKSQDRFYRLLYSKLSDPSMYLGTKHVTMFFNLIYKSMKYDTKDIRIVAFAKRLLQTATISGSAAIIAGALFLISEVMRSKNGLKISVEQNIPTVYNSAARDPSFALLKEGQESGGASLWEMSMLLFHFHPSVVKFSETIGHISYNSDPLRNFTLAPFLDRFAYKQPKAAEKSTSRGRDRFIQGKSSIATTSVPLNDSSLLGVSNVAVEDKFFHRYFEERARRDEKKGIVRNAKKKSEEDDDDEDDDIEAIHANEANLDAYFDDMDSDPEEDAFVTQLAERMMNEHEGGKANFDDEDPSDMEGWDIDSDDDNEDGKFDDDDDAEGWNEDSSNSSLDDQVGEEKDADDDVDLFMEDENNTSEEELSIDDPFENEGDDSSWIEADEDSQEQEAKHSSTQKKKKEKPSAAFEDADNYEELIARSWAERDNKKKRKKENDATTSFKSEKQGKKKKKK